MSIEASKYAIPGEFDKLIQLYGGSRLNAFTTPDITAYFNEFIPQYFREWAELNSERLINPVFRLFQSELETVYEEKNMYSDNMFYPAVNKILERVFDPHPYKYPVIGNTENLKNPNLSEMKSFFEKYYIANNMALILSGNIDVEAALPIIEETFGRIRAGELPEREFPQPASFNGVEKYKLKLPVPLFQVRGQIWRGAPLHHEDEIPLKILASLLNNSHSTGALDSLMSNKKVYAAGGASVSLNDTGLLGVLYVPKQLVMLKSKAMRLVNQELDRIKSGEISDAAIRNTKMEMKRELLTMLESPERRALLLMQLYSNGIAWGEYMESIDKIDSYTKEDIVDVANRYFTDNYLQVDKTMGLYKKESMQKPGFAPIPPVNIDSASVFATYLDSINTRNRLNTLSYKQPAKFIDFEEDIKTYSLAPLVTLYTKENTVNDIFHLTLSYKIGKIENLLISPMSSYISLLGSEEYTFTEFYNKLRGLGSTIDFSVDNTTFSVKVRGFDSEYKETLELLEHLLQNIKGDKAKLKLIQSGRKMNDRVNLRSPDGIAGAMISKVVYGEQSGYINVLAPKEYKKLTSDQLLSTLDEVLKTECDIHFSGNITDSVVIESLMNRVGVVNRPTDKEAGKRSVTEYLQPKVFFYHISKAKQSIICLYSAGEISDENNIVDAELFSNYFGTGMSSVLFQEV